MGIDVSSNITGDVAGLLALPYQMWSNWDAKQTQKNQFTEQMDFARESRDRMWEREDNAITRRVQDLENAGLHKSLAVSGGGAASSYAPSPGASSVPTPRMEGLQAAMQWNIMNRKQKNEDRLTQAQVGSLNAQAGEATERTKWYEQDSNTRLGHLKVAQSTFALAEKAESRLQGADDRAAQMHRADMERVGLDIDQMKYHLNNMMPAQYKSLILDNLRKSNEVEGSALQNLQRLGDLRLQSFKEEATRLSIAAAHLGISTQKLENSILAHDAEVILSSGLPSFARGRDSNIRDYLNTLIPGNSSGARNARRILQPILSSDSFLLRTSYGVLKDAARILF